MKYCITLIVVLLTISTISANVIEVPNDYSSIQLAINNAQNYDTILVSPGQYNENLTITNLSVSIIGDTLNPQNCIINGQNIDTIVEASSLTSDEMEFELAGFKLINCLSQFSYAVHCMGGITYGNINVKIHHNLISSFYEGIVMLRVTKCHIYSNEIVGNTNPYYDDSLYGIVIHGHCSDYLIKNNVVDGARINGILVVNGNGTIRNNIIYYYGYNLRNDYAALFVDSQYSDRVLKVV